MNALYLVLSSSLLRPLGLPLRHALLLLADGCPAALTCCWIVAPFGFSCSRKCHHVVLTPRSPPDQGILPKKSRLNTKAGISASIDFPGRPTNTIHVSQSDPGVDLLIFFRLSHSLPRHFRHCPVHRRFLRLARGRVGETRKTPPGLVLLLLLPIARLPRELKLYPHIQSGTAIFVSPLKRCLQGPPSCDVRSAEGLAPLRPQLVLVCGSDSCRNTLLESQSGVLLIPKGWLPSMISVFGVSFWCRSPNLVQEVHVVPLSSSFKLGV